jgi:hypothetical protein
MHLLSYVCLYTDHQGGARGEGEGGSGASPVLTAEDLYRRAGWLTPDNKQPAQQQQVYLIQYTTVIVLYGSCITRGHAMALWCSSVIVVHVVV